MRPVDLERIARARDGVKALRQFELKKTQLGKGKGKGRGKGSGNPSHSHDETAERGYEHERHQSGKAGKKMKSAKGKKKDDPKFGARGNATRRLSKRRAIKKGQSPGSGVRRAN